MKSPFDKVAPYYDLMIKGFFLLAGGEKRIREKTAKILKIKPGDKVLDVGCGTANLLYYLNKNSFFAFNYLGIDLSLPMLKQAKKKNFINLKVINASGTNLPFKNNAFNLIYATLFLHEVPYKIRKFILKEIKRVLHPQGKLIIFEFKKPENILGKVFNFIPRLIEKESYLEMLRHNLTKELTKEKFFIKNQQSLILDNFEILVCEKS